jgi:single-strand DNA-binding protein
MNHLNSILIEGNLVRDPEYKTVGGGTPLCNMSIAVNRWYKKGDGSGSEQEVSYFDVAAWGKLADACRKIGSKGRGLRVVGRLKQERWQEADGKARSKVLITADHIEWGPERDKERQSEPDVWREEQRTEVPF